MKSIDRLSSERTNIKCHKSTRAIEKVWTRDYWQINGPPGHGSYGSIESWVSCSVGRE